MRLHFSRSQQGFTLIELLVTATIISMLTVIGLVSYRQASITSRDAKRKADLETVRQALVLYKSENTLYPAYPSGNAYTNFKTMIGVLSTAKYLSGTGSIIDPKDTQATGNGTTPAYGYYYSSTDGKTFGVCAFLETGSPPPYCVTNP